MDIKIKYFTEDIDKLRYVDGKSDWIDLRAAATVEMKKGEFKLIPLGVAMALPKGYEAHIVPRSSTFKNFGIIQTNHMGVVDESYCGPNDQWFFPALAMRDTRISKNDRICQFRIMEHQPSIEFINLGTGLTTITGNGVTAAVISLNGEVSLTGSAYVKGVIVGKNVTVQGNATIEHKAVEIPGDPFTSLGPIQITKWIEYF